ncbi:MAG: DUF1501 domain-containing protein [Nitrososphaerales archaeon]
MTINRRQFLTGVLGGSAAAGLVHFSGMGSLLSMAEASASSVPKNGPFVLLTLTGGNDGLNTVIPYNSGTYYDWRGELAIPADQALHLGSEGAHDFGFHPSLTSLQSLWKQGKVAIINGVEYPDPNFSHFQSTYIWQTAQLSGDPSTGWLGRWLDATGPDPFRALSIGPNLPPVLVGAKQQACSLVDSTSPGNQLPGQNPQFSAAYRQLMSTFPGEPGIQAEQAISGKNLLTIGSKAAAALSHEQTPTATSGRDAGDIGNQLDIVADLIRYGLPTSVYSVDWGGFDTHSAQAENHAGLLSSLDAAIESFMSVFPTATPGKSPVILIYSEFGRTTRVNASAGTDHSSASVVLVVGPGVKGGFYGATPSFTHLDPYGNLIYTTDFRKVYATVLERILGIESPEYVLGGSFSPIDFL